MISERFVPVRVHVKEDADAFKRLGDTNLKDMQVQGGAPEFSVTSSDDVPPCDPAISRDDGSAQLPRAVPA